MVQRDTLPVLGIRGWRSKAANRDEWRHLTREAKARKGLQRHIWMDRWMYHTQQLCGYNTKSATHSLQNRSTITTYCINICLTCGSQIRYIHKGKSISYK
jgi:hypothetical protein